jgi:hypothetical protein
MARGTKGVALAWGGCFFRLLCPRETHTRRLVGVSTHVLRRRHFHEMRGSRWGVGETVALVVVGGRSKLTKAHIVQT